MKKTPWGIHDQLLNKLEQLTTKILEENTFTSLLREVLPKEISSKKEKYQRQQPLYSQEKMKLILDWAIEFLHTNIECLSSSYRNTSNIMSFLTSLILKPNILAEVANFATEGLCLIHSIAIEYFTRNLGTYDSHQLEAIQKYLPFSIITQEAVEITGLVNGDASSNVFEVNFQAKVPFDPVLTSTGNST